MRVAEVLFCLFYKSGGDGLILQKLQIKEALQPMPQVRQKRDTPSKIIEQTEQIYIFNILFNKNNDLAKPNPPNPVL